MPLEAEGIFLADDFADVYAVFSRQVVVAGAGLSMFTP